MAISTLGGVSGGSKQPKSATFTSSGTWTVPSGVTSARVTCVGAGGVGYTSNWAGGGGGVISGIVDVSTYGSIPVTVGGAGFINGGNGGDSSFGSLLLSQGGRSQYYGGATTTTPNVFGYDYLSTLTTVTSPHAYLPHGRSLGKYHISVNGQSFTNGTGPTWIWRADSKTWVNGYRPHSDNFNGNGNKFFEFNGRIIWYNDSYINNSAITGSPNPINGFWYSKSKTDIDATAANGSFNWEPMTGFPTSMTNRTAALGPIYISNEAMYYASYANGVWKTIDGISWTQVIATDPSSSFNKIGLYIDNQGRMVVVSTQYNSNFYVYRTTTSAWTAWETMGASSTNNGQPGYLAGMSLLQSQVLRYNPTQDRFWFATSAYYNGQVTTSNVQLYANIFSLPSTGTGITAISSNGFNFNNGNISPSYGDYSHFWINDDGSMSGHFSKVLTEVTDPFLAAPVMATYTLPTGADQYLALAGSMKANAQIVAIESNNNDSGTSYVYGAYVGNKGHEGQSGAAGGAGGPGIYYDATYRIGGQGIDGYGWGSSSYNVNGTTQGSGSFYGYAAKNGVVIIEWWE